MTKKRVLNEKKQALPGQTARRVRLNAGDRAYLHCVLWLDPKSMSFRDGKK